MSSSPRHLGRSRNGRRGPDWHYRGNNHNLPQTKCYVSWPEISARRPRFHAEAEAPNTQRNSTMPRGSALPLRRFLEEENGEWNVYVEQDPTYAVSNDGTEAQRQKGK